MSKSASKEPLGLKRIEALHYYVQDLDRSRRFYCDRLDFQEVARERGGDERARASSARPSSRRAPSASSRSEPAWARVGRAHRWLEKHPMGVGTVVFEVEDVERLLHPQGDREPAAARRSPTSKWTRGRSRQASAPSRSPPPSAAPPSASSSAKATTASTPALRSSTSAQRGSDNGFGFDRPSITSPRTSRR